MKRLRPSATAGAPGSVAPMVSKSPPETCARYQVDGSRALRCGSFASIGLPLAVSVPSTTQLFEPSASLAAPPSRKSRTVGSPFDRLRASAVDQVDGGSVARVAWVGWVGYVAWVGSVA